MGFLASLVKRITSNFAPPPPAKPRDAIVQFLQGWQSGSLGNWTQNRIELVNHFRSWPYVAIKSICEEIACQTPQICRIVEGAAIEAEMTRSLHLAKSFQERDQIRRAYARRLVPKSLRRKALAHMQQDDEMEPVDKSHPLVKLLQNPNGPDVAWTFFYRIPMYLMLTGTAYIYVAPNRVGQPCQLWVVPSHWVREFPHDVHGQPVDKLVGSYEITPSAGYVANDYSQGWFLGGGGRRKVDESEIIKISFPSPISLVDGWAPTAAVGQWIDISGAIGNSRVQTFYNGAFPGVVLQLDKEVAAPTQDELIRIMAKFEEKAVGVRNSRRSYVLAPGMTLAPYGQTSVEMDYVNSETQSRDQLLAAFRVGPTVAGITEQTSYAADTAARLGFYHSTLKPLLMLIGQVMTEKLASRFGEDLVVYWQDPTPDDPEFVLKRNESMFRNSSITPNEIRADAGMEPFEYGGDDPMGSMGQQPLPWATGEMPGVDGMGMEQGIPTPFGGAADGGVDAMFQEMLGSGGAGAEEEGGGKDIWTASTGPRCRPRWENQATGEISYKPHKGPNEKSLNGNGRLNGHAH